MSGIILRLVIYFLLVALAAEVLRWEILYIEAGWQYSEFGYTEWTQSALLLVSTILLAANARRSEEFRQLSVCMALAFCVLLIRENDQVFELVMMHGIWKYFAMIPLLIGAVYLWKNRTAVSEQSVRFSRTSGFGVLLSGFAVLVFSRLFGRSDYWEIVMGDGYMRIVKNAAEEGVEFLGLALMLVAVIEFVFFGAAKGSRLTSS